MDLNDMDPDSPVLWLRVDPEMTLLRSIRLEQPDYMWQYMLRYEKCVVAQVNVSHTHLKLFYANLSCGFVSLCVIDLTSFSVILCLMWYTGSLIYLRDLNPEFVL